MPRSPVTVATRYRITEAIGEGGISTVYRAVDEAENGAVVAIKLLKEAIASKRIEDIIRFQAEAVTVSRLEHPSVIRIHDTGEHEGRHYLVMDLVDGRSLAAIMAADDPPTVGEAVFIVRTIAQALDYIHSSGVIHRDIKPGNILVPRGENGHDFARLVIIDFGLAQMKDLSALYRSDEVAGTFGYMAPEQCGVIKRAVDERSDLYSLGILFYHLVTRRMPFTGDTVSALIHQHIARLPEPPRAIDDTIPPVLEQVICKLIAKEPERRYQSARGLLADLDRFLGGRDDFVLGTNDRISRLNYRTVLVGREKEYDALVARYTGVMRGTGSVCLVGGEAGRGKSRLIEELCTYVRGMNGLYIDGKCFSGANKPPFGPLKEAANVYLRFFGKYSALRQESIRTRLRAALDPLSEIVTQFNPPCAALIGAGETPVPLDPEKEAARFLSVVARFFRTLGEIERGLVIVLDDLQWCDEGTIAVLLEIIQGIDQAPLLVVGTYRDNEIAPEGPLARFIRQAGERSLPVHDIRLELFDRARMRQFVEGLLFDTGPAIGGIADLVLSKSGGNPFFAIEILKQLVDEKALVPGAHGWSVDRAVLEDAQIAPTILDILLKRIATLPPDDIALLSYASVIGRKFEIEILFRLMPAYSIPAIVSIVDRAVRLQLLEEDRNDRGKIIFVHDRIREAFYQNIAAAELSALHGKIAATLEELHPEPGDDALFEIAHHWIAAGDREHSLRFAHPAGLRAMRRYANDEALKYFTTVTALLSESGDTDSPLMLECLRHTADILLMTGRHDEAIALYTTLRARMGAKYEQAAVIRQISDAYWKKGDFPSCERTAAEGLSLLGERLPLGKIAVAAGTAVELCTHALHVLAPRLFVRRRDSRSERHKLMIAYYHSLNWSYIYSDLLKFIRSILRMLNISQRRIGPSRELGLSLGGYASLCMAIPRFGRALTYHRRSLAMRDELRDEPGLVESHQFIGYCYQWMGEYRKSIEHFEESLSRARTIGDMLLLNQSVNGLLQSYYYLSDYENGMTYLDEFFAVLERRKDLFSVLWGALYRTQYAVERGDYAGAESTATAALPLCTAHGMWIQYCILNTELAGVYLEQGDTARAREHIETARRLFEKNNFMRHYTVHLYTRYAEVLIAEHLARAGTGRGSRGALRAIRRACRTALRKTKSWPAHHAGALRESARAQALSGNHRAAGRLFQRSIDHAERIGRRHELARAMYDYGRFLADTGHAESARKRLETAYRIFSEIGAAGFLKKTEERLGMGGGEAPSAAQRLMDRQRLSSIITVSQDISSILDIDELIDTILAKAIEVTGAQNGALFLVDETGAELVVRAATGPDADEAAHSRHIVADVFRHAKTVISLNAEADRALGEYHSVVEQGLKSVLCVPIRQHERVLGVCYLDNRLSSGVFTDEDARVLEALMAQAAIAIENSALYNNLERKVDERTSELTTAYQKLNEAYQKVEEQSLELKDAYDKLDLAYHSIKKDLTLARHIQQNILPAAADRIGDLGLAIRYIPMGEIGGDLYDIAVRDGGALRVFIADATGHGVQAALVTMIIKSEYEMLKNAIASPAELLETLNSEFMAKYASLVVFFTGVVADIDTARGSITYASAGHPDQFLIRGGAVKPLQRTGRAVGLHDSINISTRTVAFGSGDRLILFTDGLFEEFNAAKELFGEERLGRLALTNAGEPAERIIERMLAAMRDFIGDEELNDDITIIGVERE